jgi:hypothetical protein
MQKTICGRDTNAHVNPGKKMTSETRTPLKTGDELRAQN